MCILIRRRLGPSGSCLMLLLLLLHPVLVLVVRAVVAGVASNETPISWSSGLGVESAPDGPWRMRTST